MKKTILAAAMAAAALCMVMPAAAETFTTSDGVLSIELPDESWKEMQDPVKWVALSDGANLITIDHYSNGETLPAMTVADDHYVNVYQAVASTQNEVFIITGCVVDAAKISDVCNAIVSTKVLQYDTKLAVKKDNTVSATEFTIVGMDQTMYALAGVNVRAGCSTSDQILGAIEAGGSVKVTGKVQRNGADYGWYQVSYNSGTGYVNASFLSDKAPAASSGSNQSSASGTKQFTGEAKTIYASNGNAVTVYKAADGYWYDGQGKQYSRTTDYEFAASDGTVFSVNKPQAQTSNTPLADGFTAFWQNGNTTHLTPYSDGYYYSSEWIRYTDNGDGTYSGADGSLLYEYDPWSGSPDDAYESDISSSQAQSQGASHKLLSQSTGYAVIVTENGDGSVTDESGNYYYFSDNGTMYDNAGTVYDILW